MRLRSTFTAVLLVAGAAFARGGELDRALDAFRKGDFKAVAEEGAKVGAMSPDRAKVLYLVGEAELVLGRFEKAEATFHELLTAKPSVPARVGLGRAMTARGKHREAEMELRAAVAEDPKDAPAQRALGEALLAMRKLEEAEAALEQAAKLAPDDPWVSRAQVELALAAGDDKGAARIAKSLCKANPKHPLGPFLAAVVLEHGGKTDEAIEAYEKALALDELFLDAHKDLAILCHTQSATYSNAERVRKSLAHYERYFALGGTDPKLEAAYRQMKQFLAPEEKGAPPAKSGK
jgi:tetratricopeptide (TPR) repeat protein